MREITFDTARMQEFLDAIAQGRPVLAGAGDQPLSDLLMLSAAAAAHVLRAELIELANRPQPQNVEHVELEVESRRDDLTARVLWLTDTALLLLAGRYDGPESVTAGVELVTIPSYNARTTPLPAAARGPGV